MRRCGRRGRQRQSSSNNRPNFRGFTTGCTAIQKLKLFSELLENSLRKYQNLAILAAQVNRGTDRTREADAGRGGPAIISPDGTFTAALPGSFPDA
jgi:hypothetical protein